MLYRSRGLVLFVQNAPARGCLVPLVIRDRREHRQARKPERPTRGAPVRPAWTREEEQLWGRPAASCPLPVRTFGERLGRWKRVSSWWLFTARQLDLILS